MKIGVPSGIGDFSWMWSKLCHVQNEIEEIEIADGWPYRTQEYVHLCGIKASYGAFAYPQILLSEKVNNVRSWKDIQNLNYGMVLIEANKHLEDGRRLEEWMPDLPTEFHYPLNVSDSARAIAQRSLMHLKGPLLGVSCASYRGSEAWKTWDREQWVNILKRIMDFFIREKPYFDNMSLITA